MSNDLDEDAIEAMIRKVAAAKAARAAADDGLASEADAQPQAPLRPDLHLVEMDGPEPGPAREEDPPGDDGPIEAAIRRVQASKAARDAEAYELDVNGPAGASAIEDAGTGSYEAPTQEHAAVRFAARGPLDAPHLVAGSGEAPSSWEEAARRLGRELAEMRRTLGALATRVDALSSGQPKSSASGTSPQPAAADDDDFDDTPQISRMPFGAPPRPAVVRDPSPMSATAEHLVEEPAAIEETRPAMATGGPESRRGLELLPRNYRITVEDKRRGVDLVPLHRALLGMDGVRDMSLLSYSNGVAIVAIESLGGIDPDALAAAVSRAMAREATVEVHNEQTMVVKLAEE